MVAAWTFTNGALKHTWTFDSAAPGWEAYSGMGNHSVTVADFDGDGCDEICVGAMTVDHDGKGLFTTDCVTEMLYMPDVLFLPAKVCRFLACMKMKAIMKL